MENAFFAASPGTINKPGMTRRTPPATAAPAAGAQKQQADGKTGLTAILARHHSGRVRSKYFKKSEKKACHPLESPLILTAKPNQTNRRN
jgi:hypothetical protein